MGQTIYNIIKIAVKILKYKLVSVCTVLIVIALMNSKVFSQERQIKFTEIQGANDINLGKINAIIQDKLGFIWLSAQNNRSIIRYDGTNMEQILPGSDDTSDPKVLGGYYPECFFADDNGILWIGFYGEGLDRYDPATKTFIHYDHDPNDPKSLANDFVTGIHRDHLGNLWIATYGGLDRLDEQTGIFTHHKHNKNDPNSLTGDSIRAIYEDKSGTLWIGTGLAWVPNSRGGLNKYNREQNNFTQYVHNPEDPTSMINNNVRAILEDSRGTFWVGTGGDGLHTMNRETGKFTRHTYDPANPNKLSRPPLGDPNSDRITFIKEDYQGNIWIGTDQNGLNVYDPVKKTITHYGEEVDNGVWWMYVSADNQIWITTNQNRLLKVTLDYTPLPGYFGQFRRKYVESDSVRWFGTDKGLIKEIQSGTNSTMQFYPIPSQGPDNVIKNWNSFTNEPISVDLLLPLIKNTEGKILYRKNLSVETRIFDPQTGKISAFENDTLGLSNFNISQILQESDSVYWIGSWDYGLMKVDLKNKVTQRFQNDPTNGRSLCSNTILHLQSDIEGNIWVATFNGLQRYNRETNDFSSFLLSTIISQILTDSQGVLWIATLNGLFYYDPLNKQFKLSPINGSIYSGFEDTKDSSLWVGADNGVYKLNASRQYISFFEMEAKNETTLINNNYWTFSEAYRLNSRIFIGSRGTSGIGKYYVFDPDKLIEPISGSMPYISALWLNEEMVEPGPNSPIHSAIEQLKSLKLANYQNIFSVSFGTIDFQDRYDDQIYYMLEGFDLDWKKTKPNDRIRFFKIPTGKYLLKIKTPNPNGTWNEKNLEILIAPPFYLTAWAYGFYFLFLCAGVYIIHKTQKARVLRKERERIKDRELLQAKEIEKAYTELKVTQSQLIQSEKMASLGELTAGIAHEIQNPLNFVNNFSEISSELLHEMKEELATGNLQPATELVDDVIQNLQKINHHGKRAADIVKGMLQHSRTSSGQKEPTDINALADEYLRLAYHGLRAKDKSFNAEFVTDFDESLPKINVIPQDIGRVLLNLINNAFYAVENRATELTPQPPKGGLESLQNQYKPTVTVTTSQSLSVEEGRGEVRISVKDNGPGIPSHIVDKIFQPFFTTKPTGSGTGLGLSLSYDIVKAHGGELKVDSEEGTGTVFSVVLKLKD